MSSSIIGQLRCVSRKAALLHVAVPFLLPAPALAVHLPYCAEAFGDSSVAVHSGNNANLNLRDDSRVFQETGVNAEANGGSSLKQQAGAVCIADDDPTVTDPGTCDTFGAVNSWVASGRSFPEPPSESYPNGPNLTVNSGQTVTIDFGSGSPVAYKRITVNDGGHLIIDDTNLSGVGEVTVRNSFAGDPGAELTLNGTAVINVDGSFNFGGDKNNDPRSVITVNSVSGNTSDTFTKGSIALEKTDVDVTRGTWRPLADGSVDIVESDVNCDSTHAAGAQPPAVMPECQDEDGGVFVISQSTGAIATSEFRGFFYTDGTQFNIDDSNIQGALTGGGMSVRGSDIVPGTIPTTGSFCQERVAGYEFDTGAGDASTCARREIRITALNRFGERLATYHDTTELETSTDNGGWFGEDENGNEGSAGATNTPADADTDDGFATQKFEEEDDGTVSLFLENIHADNLRITATDPEQGVAGTSGILSFRDNAFVIESVDDFGEDVIANRDHVFEATLWQRDPGDTGAGCVVPETYNDSSQSVRLWTDRHADDPNGQAPNATALNTGATATLPDSDPGSPNMTLDFSDNADSDAGRARFELSTSDVGKYALALAEDNSGFAVDADGTPRLISGGSVGYVVRPFGFHVDAIDNPAATSATGDIYRPAGADFTVEVSAVGWDATDDANDDGIPDGYGNDDPVDNASLGDNTVLPAFGSEGTPEVVNLESVLWLPSGGNDPELAGETTVDGDVFADSTEIGPGEAAAVVQYPEVGVIELRAGLDNYLGGGRPIPGRSEATGRFTPADFEQTASDGMFRNTCAATFTYLGETFGYESGGLPALTITARNEQGQTTRNYTDLFAKLVAADVQRSGPTGDGTTDGSDGTPLAVDPDLQQGTLTDNGDGTLTYTFDADDGYRYERNIDRDGDGVNDARVAPFDTDLTVTIDAIEDSDDVNAPDGNREDVTPDAARIRFGRLVIENAAGAEIAPIEQVIRAEYFAGDVSGDQWDVNADDDGCTAFTLGSPDHEIELARGQRQSGRR